jgi:putative transposase
VEEVIKEKQTGISRACRVMATSRSSLRYRSVKEDGSLETELRRLAEKHPEEGFWKSYLRIRNAGGKVNNKRLYRVYKAIGLSIRRKAKKRLPDLHIAGA